MIMSRDGALELAGEEACVQTRYLDSAKVWTFGIGHTKAAGPPDPVTCTTPESLPFIFSLFQHDVARYAADVEAACSHYRLHPTQAQFDAIVMCHYNTGRGRALVAALAVTHNGAAFSLYNHVGGKVNAALVARRARERHIYETGQYLNHGHTLLIPATPNGRLIWAQAKRIDLGAMLPAVSASPSTQPVKGQNTP